MLWRIAFLIFFIVLGIIILSSQTYAAPHTFSVYGHVQYDNDTSIRGTAVRLYEPIDNTSRFNLSMPAIQSTVTDNNGNYQLINITTNYSICGLCVYFPVNWQYAMPLFFQKVNTSGIQYINITDVPPPNPELTSYTSSEGNDVIIWLGLGVVCLFGLFCLYKALHHKK